jgi:hypothetical protein
MSDKPNYSDVPADYPRCEVHGSISGAQPKLLLSSAPDGYFYIPGNTPQQRWEDWTYSANMVTAMAERCRETKSGERAHMTEEEIILQYYQRALKSGGRYGTEDQLKWTFRKVAESLDWPIPFAISLPSP